MMVISFYRESVFFFLYSCFCHLLSFTLLSVKSCVSRCFILKPHTGSCMLLFWCNLHFGWFSTATHTGAPGHLCVICGRHGMRVYYVNASVWRYRQNCASTAGRLRSSHTENRATGACIHFNTADQQAAVVCGRSTGIKRRLGFFSCCNSGLLELRERGLKGGLSFKEKTDKSQMWKGRCVSRFGSRFFFLLQSRPGACEMQPLPDRCVAPQLQPTGLYRHNQSAHLPRKTFSIKP